jgi:hypothetical protein
MGLPLCNTEEDLIGIVLICFVLFVTGDGAFSNFYLAVKYCLHLTFGHIKRNQRL